MSFAVGNAALAQLEARGEGLATYAARDRRRGARRGAPAGRRLAHRRARAGVAGPPGRRGRALGHARSRSWGPSGRRSSSSTRRRVPEWGDEARAARAAFRHPGGGRVRLTALELPVADRERVAQRVRARSWGSTFDARWRAVVGEQSIVLSDEAGGEAGGRAGRGGRHGAPEVVRLGVRWRRVPASDCPGRAHAAPLRHDSARADRVPSADARRTRHHLPHHDRRPPPARLPRPPRRRPRECPSRRSSSCTR